LGKGYRLTRQGIVFFHLSLLCFLAVITMVLWHFWNSHFHYKQELEQYREQNLLLRRDLRQQEEEMQTMEEQIRELEEILGKREEMYRQVKLEGEGANFNLTRPSGFSAEMLEDSFSRYAGGALQGAGEEFVLTEKKHGINAVALAAISINETGWGRSRLARQKNNYFGWAAFDHAPYRSALEFTSREHSIEYVGSRIKENYLEPEGVHYHGPTLLGMNRRYASDNSWAEKTAQAMKKLAANAITPEEAEKYFSYEAYKRLYDEQDYYYLKAK